MISNLVNLPTSENGAMGGSLMLVPQAQVSLEPLSGLLEMQIEPLNAEPETLNPKP